MLKRGGVGLQFRGVVVGCACGVGVDDVDLAVREQLLGHAAQGRHTRRGADQVVAFGRHRGIQEHDLTGLGLIDRFQDDRDPHFAKHEPCAAVIQRQSPVAKRIERRQYTKAIVTINQVGY